MVIDGVGVTPLDANHCPGSVMFLFRIPHCRVKQAGGPREAGPDGGAAATGGLEGNGGGEGSCEPIGVAWGAGQGAGQGGEAGCDSIWQEQVVRGDTTPQGGDAGGEPEANGEESDAEVEEVLGFGKASGRHLGFSGAEPASAGGRLVVPAKDGGCCGAGVGTGMGATTSNGRAGAHEEEDGEESDDDVIMVEEEGVEQQEAGEGEGGGGGKGGQMGAEAKAEEGVGAGASCGGAAECGCASPYKTAEAQLRAGDTYNVLHTGDCRCVWLGCKGVPAPRPAPKHCYAFPAVAIQAYHSCNGCLPVPVWSSCWLSAACYLFPNVQAFLLPSDKRANGQQLPTTQRVPIIARSPLGPALQVAAVDAGAARPGRRARGPAVP